MVIRTLLAGALAAASLVGTASPALARDLCSGVYEADGCEYCSYEAGLDGQPPSYCDAGYSGYYWAQCTLWVYDACVTGALN